MIVIVIHNSYLSMAWRRRPRRVLKSWPNLAKGIATLAKYPGGRINWRHSDRTTTCQIANLSFLYLLSGSFWNWGTFYAPPIKFKIIHIQIRKLGVSRWYLLVLRLCLKKNQQETGVWSLEDPPKCHFFLVPLWPTTYWPNSISNKTVKTKFKINFFWYH